MDARKDAEIHFGKKDYSTALSLYLSIEASKTTSADQVKIAICYSRLGKLPEAIDLLEKAVQEKSHDRLFNVWLGKFYLEQKSFDLSAQMLSIASQKYNHDLGIARDFLSASIANYRAVPDRQSRKLLLRSIYWSSNLLQNVAAFSDIGRIVSNRLLELRLSLLTPLTRHFSRIIGRGQVSEGTAVLWTLLSLQCGKSPSGCLEELSSLKICQAKESGPISNILRTLINTLGRKHDYFELPPPPEESIQNSIFKDVPFVGINTIFPKICFSSAEEKLMDGPINWVRKAQLDPSSSTVILLAADVSYVRRYAERFINGIWSYSPNTSIHLHIVHHTQEEIGNLFNTEKILNDERLGVSHLSTRYRSKTFYASARFLVADEIMTKYDKGIVITDIDGVVNTPPAESLYMLEKLKCEVGIGLPRGFRKSFPWLQYAAGFVYLPRDCTIFGNISIKFEEIFKSLVSFEALEEDNPIHWMLDQNVIFKFINSIPMSSVSDIHLLRFYHQPLGHKD